MRRRRNAQPGEGKTDVAEFFAKFGVEQWLALMSAVLAISSFFLNLRLVARQERRNAANLKLAHDSDIIGWSDNVIEALASAQEMLAEKGVSYGETEFPSRRSSARAQISALIDRGRACGRGSGGPSRIGAWIHRKQANPAVQSTALVVIATE